MSVIQKQKVTNIRFKDKKFKKLHLRKSKSIYIYKQTTVRGHRGVKKVPNTVAKKL